MIILLCLLKLYIFTCIYWSGYKGQHCVQDLICSFFVCFVLVCSVGHCMSVLGQIIMWPQRSKSPKPYSQQAPLDIQLHTTLKPFQRGSEVLKWRSFAVMGEINMITQNTMTIHADWLCFQHLSHVKLYIRTRKEVVRVSKNIPQKQWYYCHHWYEIYIALLFCDGKVLQHWYRSW